MWTLGIIFMTAISICGSQPPLKCKKMVPDVHDPHCGIGTKCHFNGLNKWIIGYEACTRLQLGLEGFLKKFYDISSNLKENKTFEWRYVDSWHYIHDCYLHIRSEIANYV
ncbi:uncharacterized protein Dana_GF26547, isoform A [Drosophila ananassae]|uniref:Uncharacterized protein, isoform A n=1 Tax=Drosophila ananassae TaxID=7217 RepID=A0A0P8Y8L1_DROAN|nr:uncharacterized protein LOC26513956 [Drosophila ananassae]KPU77778.1 uncharacterized protein Dana_GF26547, isoform A [Drosophila ananassae]